MQYMAEVLERFNEWDSHIQEAFIALLSATSVPLGYFTGEASLDTHASTASRIDNKDLFLTMEKERSANKSSAQQKPTNNSEIITAHNATELDKIRVSQLQTQISIQITLINTGEHPLYRMQLSSKDSIYKVEQTLRFASYRDFQQSVMEKCSLKILSEFPETKARSSLGIKLTEEELNERAMKLNKVSVSFCLS